MTKKLLLACLLTANTLLTASTAATLADSAAQKPATVGKDTIPLPTMQVTTRQPSPTLHAAESVAAIDAQTIASVAASHPTELLSRAPGVWISRGSGQEHLTAIRSPVLTGAGACGNFLITEDGIPIRPSGFCNVNNLFETFSEVADAVEVVRGPGSALYGSNALHGMINVVSPWLAEDATNLSLESGSNDYHRALASLSQADGASAWRLDALANRSRSFRADEGYSLYKSRVQWRGELGAASARFNLTAIHLNQDTAGFILGENAYKDARERRKNLNPEAFRRASAVRLNAEFDFDLGTDVRLELRPYAHHSNMDFLQHFLPGKPLEENGQNSFGLLSLLRYRFGEVDWISGMDLEYAHIALQETQARAIGDGSAFLRETRPTGRHYDYQVGSLSEALYTRAEWSPAPRWNLTAGVRLESTHYRYDNHLLDGNSRDDGTLCTFGGCLFSRPADRNDRFTVASPKLGVSFRFAPGWRLFSRLSQGFRAPQTSELYRLQSGQTVADLKAVRLRSAELGLKGRQGKLSAQIVAFRARKKNDIIRDAQGFNVTDAGTRHRGVEWQVNWHLLPRWSLAGDGSYARHTYANSYTAPRGETIAKGNTVDTAPNWIGNTRIDWNYTAGNHLELEWQFLDGYFLDAANAHRYPGHSLFNLRWRQGISAHWSLSTRLSNLADKRYAERADFAFGNFRYFPGAGRALFVSMDWRA